MTYGIIQEHGGAIEAISRPGEGTCFHLEFPVVRKSSERVISLQREISEPSSDNSGVMHSRLDRTGAAKARILIVDDEIEIRETSDLCSPRKVTKWNSRRMPPRAIRKWNREPGIWCCSI